MESDMEIRGSALRSRKAFAEEHFGAGAWDKVLETLPESDRILLKGLLLPAGWYPFDTGERLDQAIVDVLGGGDPEVFEQIGRQSARQNLSGVHKTFLKAGHPGDFLAQSASIYNFYYDTGSREYLPTGPKSGVIRTSGAETFSRADCLTVIGWHKEALEMCGARQVRISEIRCRANGDDVCEYAVQWE
jgi:hypothetical protein